MNGRLEDAKLVAYIDGELTEEGRKEVEKVLEIDELSRQALAELRAQREVADTGDRDGEELGAADMENGADAGEQSVFSCGNCEAKYTIAFEKVRGKVFRVNCKKCSETIIIKGDAEISSDVPLSYSNIPERPSLIGTPMPSFEPAAVEQNQGNGSPSIPSAQVALSDGSLFSSDVDALGRGETDSAQDEDADRSFPESFQRIAGPSVPTTSQAMEMSQSSSVLFSRSGLENLAASSAHAETKPSSSPSFLDESSGLIDIRALGSPIYEKKAAEEDRDDDDIMSLGAAPTSFNPPVLTPQSVERMNTWMKITIICCVVAVLVVGGILWKTTLSSDAPQATSQQIVALQQKLEQLQQLQKKNAKLATAVGAKVDDPDNGANGRDNAVDEQVVEENTTELVPPQKNRGGTSNGETSKIPPPPELAARQKISPSKPDNKPVSADDAEPSAEADSKPANEESSSTIPDSPYAGQNEEPASLKEVASERKAGKEVDELLAPKPASAPQAPAPQEETPAPSSVVLIGAKPKLDRSDVQKGMNAVAGLVKACGQGQPGRVTVKVVIGQTGRVASAVAVGTFAGTAAGSCAAKEVRKAKFPLSQTTLTVKYPFNLQ